MHRDHVDDSRDQQQKEQRQVQDMPEGEEALVRLELSYAASRLEASRDVPPYGSGE